MTKTFNMCPLHICRELVNTNAKVWKGVYKALCNNNGTSADMHGALNTNEAGFGGGGGGGGMEESYMNPR